jgi:hypothetical protein
MMDSTDGKGAPCMADPQDRPDHTPEQAPGAGPTPPAPPAPSAGATPPVHGDEPAKKAPGKKAPAKAAKKSPPAAPKKAPAKKATAKKAPGKKAVKKEPPKKAPAAAPPVETNGQVAEAAKDAAAHAKSTVEAAINPVSGHAAPPSAGRSPVPFAVAIAVSLLALLLVRRLRRRDS